MKVNEGEVPQYYVENSHPAIIPPEEWALVQTEFARRKEKGHRRCSDSVFASTIICGDCGASYGSKLWHSTDKYRRTIWQCNNKFKGDHRCTTPHLYESEIKELFLKAFSKMIDMRENILEDCRLLQSSLADLTELEIRSKATAEEIEFAAELIRRCVDENSLKVQNQEEYLEQYERHIARYEKLK